MRKLIILIIIITFLTGCSQKVFLELDKNYNPELKTITGQDSASVKYSDVLGSLNIDEEEYEIKTKKDREIIKISRAEIKNLANKDLKSGKNGDWELNFNKKKKAIIATPKTNTIPIVMKRQSKEDYTQFLPFKPADIENVTLSFQDITLSKSRYFEEINKPDQIELKIPTISKIKMDDYLVEVSIDAYEKYSQNLSDIENKEIRLKLKRGSLQFDFVNKENSEYNPRELFFLNTNGDVTQYTGEEIDNGVSFYEIEFPINVYGNTKRWQFYNEKGGKVDTLVFNQPGMYKFNFLEKTRDFPLVFFDLSEGQITLEKFEKWLKKLETDADGVFLYATNGYEKLFNPKSDELKKVVNQLHRTIPRTSNILESISTFSNTIKKTNLMKSFYGTPQNPEKVLPKFYFFLSVDNINRLQYDVDRFNKHIDDLQIQKKNITIFTPDDKNNQAIIKELKSKNFKIILL